MSNAVDPIGSNSICSICDSHEEFLFSNRPLHKGREPTLLICSKCTQSVLNAKAPLISGKPCSWCGGLNDTMALNEFRICIRCVDLCCQIATDSLKSET